MVGIDEITIDAKGKKLTILGTVDPVSVVSKLRKKNLPAGIISVGPAKEPQKKEEPKKEEPKKEEPKKDEAKGETKKDDPKKEETKKDEPKKEEEKKAEPARALAPAPAPVPAPVLALAPAPAPEPVVGTITPYRPYYPPMHMQYYVHPSMEENPNACIIC